MVVGNHTTARDNLVTTAVFCLKDEIKVNHSEDIMLHRVQENPPSACHYCGGSHLFWKYRRNRKHLRQTRETTPDVDNNMETENDPPSQTTATATTTTPPAEAAVKDDTAGQQMITRSGRAVGPPVHLEDYVRE
ncbi:Hypp6483 [Branchiostoma lanceolatum]|uniref:Hypp6483 protein n=1 Tax=Branchiostoma lanceolatum TaxID=7740 RepID=A0A8K0EA60_BRALA|nr:Hypp6483 [Branchiostoma lanceolatum]